MISLIRKLAFISGVAVSVCFTTLISFAASKEKIYISTGAIKPFTIDYTNNPAEIAGFFGEIMISALKNAGMHDQITVEWLPWKRAQKNAQRKPNRIIGPLTRTAAREKLYIWISEIVTVTCRAWSINPKLNTYDIAALEKLSLGSLAGSPPETEVLRMYPSLKPVMQGSTKESTNALKILNGRLDVWVTQNIVGHYYLKLAAKEMGIKPPKLIPGRVFFNQPIWVAANRDTPPKVVAKLRKAFENFKTTQQFADFLKLWEVGPD